MQEAQLQPLSLVVVMAATASVASFPYGYHQNSWNHPLKQQSSKRSLETVRAQQHSDHKYSYLNEILGYQQLIGYLCHLNHLQVDELDERYADLAVAVVAGRLAGWYHLLKADMSLGEASGKTAPCGAIAWEGNGLHCMQTMHSIYYFIIIIFFNVIFTPFFNLIFL